MRFGVEIECLFIPQDLNQHTQYHGRWKILADSLCVSYRRNKTNSPQIRADINNPHPGHSQSHINSFEWVLSKEDPPENKELGQSLAIFCRMRLKYSYPDSSVCRVCLTGVYLHLSS